MMKKLYEKSYCQISNKKINLKKYFLIGKFLRFTAQYHVEKNFNKGELLPRVIPYACVRKTK